MRQETDDYGAKPKRSTYNTVYVGLREDKPTTDVRREAARVR
jgi:hypothetical protein